MKRLEAIIPHEAIITLEPQVAQHAVVPVMGEKKRGLRGQGGVDIYGQGALRRTSECT
jgi:hypothetical protein